MQLFGVSGSHQIPSSHPGTTVMSSFFRADGSNSDTLIAFGDDGNLPAILLPCSQQQYPYEPAAGKASSVGIAGRCEELRADTVQYRYVVVSSGPTDCQCGSKVRRRASSDQYLQGIYYMCRWKVEIQ